MTDYHDAAGTNPTLESMLDRLTDDALTDIVRALLRAFNDASMRKTLPAPDVIVDARTALTSGRLTDSLAASIRRALEALSN